MTQTQPASPRAPKSRRRRRRPAANTRQPRGGHLALAAGLLALAASAYLIYQSEIAPRIGAGGGQQQRLEAIEQRLAEQTGRLAAQADVSARLGQSEAALTALDARLQAWRGELREQQAAAREREQAALREVREVADSLAALRAETTDRRSADAWRLAEAEQLLVIANQRLQLGGDVALAGKALALADRRLRTLADPALGPVRSLIADEIVALDRVAGVDVAGTLNRMSALSRALGELPLAGDAPNAADAGDAPAAAPAAEPQPEADGWLATGRSLLADLGRLVQVETIEPGPPQPLMSAGMRAMVYANARLIVESAQAAFVRGDNGVYAERIAAAGAWVNEHFDTGSVAVRAWLARLDELAALQPAPGLPDISRSLQALREAGGGR